MIEKKSLIMISSLIIKLSEFIENPNKIKKENSLNLDEYGKYYALLIGNWDYKFFPQLVTPKNDITALNQVLMSKYNFNTKIIKNASRRDVIKGIYDMAKIVKPEDNFILYYAGHGELNKKMILVIGFQQTPNLIFQVIGFQHQK